MNPGEGKTDAQIDRIVRYSNKMIRNAMLFVKKDEAHGKKPLRTNLEVKRLVRSSKEPFSQPRSKKKGASDCVEIVRLRFKQKT